MGSRIAWVCALSMLGLGISVYGQAEQQDPAPPYQPQPATPTPDLSGVPWWQWPHLTGDWAGYRHTLDERGVLIRANFTEDFSHNFIGGVNTASERTGSLFNFNITLDLDKLVHLHGGQFFVNFVNENGRYIQPDVQAAQNPDHNDAGGTTQISEIWYQQNFRKDVIQLKGGKIDANNDFDYINGGAEFIHDAFGNSPTVLDMPTYPQNSFGGDLFYLPKKGLYAGVGIFDGAAQQGIDVGERGPATLFGAPADLFLIGEVGAKWAGNFPGRIGAGVWDATGTFHKFNSGYEDGTQGFYATLDQTLYRTHPEKVDDPRGVAVFGQYGYADPAVSLFEQHIGGGIIWIGALPTRDNDVVGAACSYVDFSSAHGSRALHGPEESEFAVEGFYKLAITPFFSVKPDMEYVHNPDGRSKDDALIFTMRFLVDF